MRFGRSAAATTEAADNAAQGTPGSAGKADSEGGGLLGFAGTQMPLLESGIAGSVLALGLLTAEWIIRRRGGLA